MTDYWNYIVTAIGLVGFYLAGKKVWWCWYINIVNQILWFTFGAVTGQWGFVAGALFYTVVFSKNAYEWTRDRKKPLNVYDFKSEDDRLMKFYEDFMRGVNWAVDFEEKPSSIQGIHRLGKGLSNERNSDED